jgi:16S rRNA (cytidine1402-2'-O)-methyltransferase
MKGNGKLYMIPIPIADDKLNTILPSTLDVIHSLHHFVTENARTARRFISSTKPPYALQEVSVLELDKHNPIPPEELLAPLLLGNNIGVMSEAGCPGIADPGSKLASWAHSNDIKVVPLVGPSSIFLALMASGLNGQTFKFHGYLAPKKDLLKQELKRLEADSRKSNCTQIFIEAPYRNRQVVEAALDVLHKNTHFSIASNLTADDEYVLTMRIAKWKNADIPDLHKKASIFLLHAR